MVTSSSPERMRAMGFHVVEPQTLPFEEQVRTFAAARIVVGPGGAGMFNTVFCRPGTAVVSVESTTNWLTAHANLFASLGHDYALVVGGADPADAGPQRRWRMDVDCVVDTVSRMMA